MATCVMLAGIAWADDSLSAAIVIDAQNSSTSNWAAISLSGGAQPSAKYYASPPGTPDASLPVNWPTSFEDPFRAQDYPLWGHGKVDAFLTGSLTKENGNSLRAVILTASSVTQLVRGTIWENGPYAFGRARVTLRLISTTGARLRITADARHTGALCLLEISGTDGTFQMRGTGTLNQSFVFADGVARVDWVIRSGIDMTNSPTINEPTASGALTLTLEELPPPGPHITAHPRSATVSAGSPITLTATANAPAEITYQWKLNGAVISGATGASYTLPSAQAMHAGAYSVVATSEGVSAASEVATLAVVEPAPSTSRLLNLSTRGLSLTGDKVLIPGFVVAGTQPKRLLIRAVGPTLGRVPYSVPGVLANPRLTLQRLRGSSYESVGVNDDWGDNANAADIAAVTTELFAFPLQDVREAVLLLDVEPGQYTVVADGVGGATGIAIVELFDADDAGVDSQLINISNRGFAGVGDHVMIPGFVVSADGPKTFLIRVVGPRLAETPYGVPGTMADPKLTVYRSQAGAGSTPLFSNDDWGDVPDPAQTADVAEQIHAFALAARSKDAALVVTLTPGAYTVVGSSADGVGTGVVLVEVYVVR